MQLPQLARLIALWAAAAAAAPTPHRLSLAPLEPPELRGWSVQKHSRIARVEVGGRAGLKWTFTGNGKTRYDNLITRSLPEVDLSTYDQVELWFLSVGPVEGRIGFQLLTPAGVVSLPDVHLQVTEGEWRCVRLDLEPHRRRQVSAFRLFCDGLQWGKGEFVFFLREVCAVRFPNLPAPEKRNYGEPLGPRFASLPAERQTALRRAAEPVPLPRRRAPYSTPMYYLMHKGRGFGRREERSPRLDRARPDWQEAMVRDWVELGLTSVHLYFYCHPRGPRVGVPHREEWLTVKRLCEKYGLGIGARLDLPHVGRTPGWGVHPLNPDRDLDAYLNWVREVATMLKGSARYYVISDELNFGRVPPDKGGWTAELYMQVWPAVAAAILSVDPAPRVSMFGASGSSWGDVRSMLAIDEYRRTAQAVAINLPHYRAVPFCAAHLKRAAPDVQLLSNGVGYISSGEVTVRNPARDKYRRYSDYEQACVIAKAMFTWWEVDAGVAPYYITLRHWVIRGKTYPRWYGFFGIEDYVVGDDDRLTVKRYPAWYAFQTIAHTFHDRPSFRTADFPVTPSAGVSKLSAFVRGDDELVLIIWQDFRKTGFTDLRIESTRFKHAVRVNLFDRSDWADVPYTIGRDGLVTLRDVRVSFEPAVIRLFAD